MHNLPMFERTRRKNQYQAAAISCVLFNLLSFLVEFIPCMYMADHAIDNDFLALIVAAIGILIIEVTGSMGRNAFNRFVVTQAAYNELEQPKP